MAITNTSKPSTSIANTTRVATGETWGTITTMWATEIRTWAQTGSLLSNVSKPLSTLTSSFSVFPTTAARNNFTGSIGFKFSVSSNVYLYKIGRLYVSGNNQDHKINVWISTNTVTPIATTTILASSSVDSNNYRYATLSDYVLLSTGNTYYIAGNQTSGGDTWKDLWATAGTINSPFSILDGAYVLTSIDTFPSTDAGFPGAMYETMDLKFIPQSLYSSIVNTSKP